MEFQTKSIRAFIGAKNFNESREFYKDLGFEELNIFPKMSYFKLGNLGFYLQDAYVKDWVDNTMLFLEVDNLELHLKKITGLLLDKKYEGVRITNIVHNDWGNEFFIYDPSGVLWHIGEFHN